MTTLGREGDQLRALLERLEAVVERDPEQELHGVAIPVLDAIVGAAKASLGDDPVAKAVPEILSPENVMAGEPVRAIDVLFVVKQLDAAVHRQTTPSAMPATDPGAVLMVLALAALMLFVLLGVALLEVSTQGPLAAGRSS